MLGTVFWGTIAAAALTIGVPMLYVAGTMLVLEPASWLVVGGSLVLAWGIAVLATKDGKRRAAITLGLTVGMSTVVLCVWFLSVLARFGD